MIEFNENEYVVEPANIQVCQFVRSINIANTKMQQVIAPEGVSNSMYATESIDLKKAATVKENITGDIVLKEGVNCSINRNISGLSIGAYVGAGASMDEPDTSRFYLKDGISDGNTYNLDSRYKSGGPKCSDILKSINGIKNSNVRLEAGEGIFFDTESEPNTLIIRKSGTQNLGACIPDPCKNELESSTETTP